jgi:hypothetical protein
MTQSHSVFEGTELVPNLLSPEAMEINPVQRLDGDVAVGPALGRRF